jgi:ATP/ADP translocase/HEAT repeat protein/CRP-like cAMP-binding protein
MDSLTNRVLTRLTNARSGERSVAFLMFAYSFLAMASYNILKTLTNSIFIDQIGADKAPLVDLAAGVLIGVIMHGYSLASHRMRRGLIVPVSLSVTVVLCVVFWALFRTSSGAQPDAFLSSGVWVAASFYFFGLILGVLLISQFWTLASDIYDARQAKRLFGFIGGGASLGSALGSGLTALVIYEVGTNGLLLVSAAILGVCAATVMAILARQPAHGASDDVDEGGGVGGREALRLLAESTHLKVIVLVVAFSAAGAAIVSQQLKMAAEAQTGSAGAEAVAAFLAQVQFYVSVVGFLVQVLLTSRIHRSLGLLFALLLLPVSLGTTAVVILVSGAIWAPQVARVLDATFRYTVDKTTREVLFLPLPAGVKLRVKPFIDVTAERFAKAVAAILILFLIQPWGLGLDWKRLSYASLTMTLLWITVALVARREYLRAFRASIGSREIAPTAMRTEVADPATVEALVEELSNPDESAVLYAIEMLEALEKRNLVSPLLLQHESPRVRARALRALASSRSQTAMKWLGTVERMVQDEDVDVRAAALHALAELAHEDARMLMRRHLSDAEPRVVVTAAIALANSGDPDDVASAESALLQIIADTREVAVSARVDAATSLAHIENPRFRPLLVPLLYDREVAVVAKAIRSARAMGVSDGLFVPGLLSLLGDRALKAEAREALVGYGEDVVPLLAHALGDKREHIWIRRHIPITLALIGTAHAMDALVASLDEPDGFLRFKAITAIEKLRRDHPSIGCPRHVLEAAVVKETSRYYNGLTLQQNFLRHALDADESLLAQALADKLRRSVDRVYRLLGLIYHVDDVAAARYTIEQGESRRRAAAVEYLDNLLGGVVRRRVMPILDDTPLAEKVRYANVVLKSRPRDLEDTLAQLVYDDDPVIAASAIHFVGAAAWSLADDLDYVIAHRPSEDAFVLEAALWAQTARRTGLPHESFPVVELVDRIRVTPLFASLSIDELFRVAGAGQEVRHQAGREPYRAGQAAQEVFFLLEGSVETSGGVGPAREITAPAVINLADVLQGRPLSATVRAIEPTIGFCVPATTFMTMVSDNVLMAQSLFKLLLGESSPSRSSYATTPGPAARLGTGTRDGRLFRQDPLLAGASAAHLLALRAAASEVRLKAGVQLFDADAPPAIYQLVSGEVRLESAGRDPILVSKDATFGVADTLRGTSSGWQATATADGRALRLDRDDLFAVMADHVDLMQSLFMAALTPREPTSLTTEQAEHRSFA